MKFFAFFLIFFSLFAEAQNNSMNGIHYKDYKNFDKSWPLVTVRFREDTKEMRFTYANKKAQKALEKQIKDYPDGAVFGKVGVATDDDPLFTSSKVPSGVRRYQLMVRDRKKFASTGGWGYALFDSEGATFPGPSETEAAQACYACHRLAGERGQVFSQPAAFSQIHFPVQGPDFLKQKLFYSDKARADMPGWVQDLIPKSQTSVRFLEGSLQEHLFQGTLDEIRPALLEESARSGRPAVLLSKDQKKISMVRPIEKKADSECPRGQKAFTAVYTTMAPSAVNSPLFTLRLCRSTTKP